MRSYAVCENISVVQGLRRPQGSTNPQLLSWTINRDLTSVLISGAFPSAMQPLGLTQIEGLLRFEIWVVRSTGQG